VPQGPAARRVSRVTQPLFIAAAVATALAGCSHGTGGGPVTDLLPDKARYQPGEAVTLTARVQAGAQYAGPIDLTVYHLDEVVHSERQDMLDSAGLLPGILLALIV